MAICLARRLAAIAKRSAKQIAMANRHGKAPWQIAMAIRHGTRAMAKVSAFLFFLWGHMGQILGREAFFCPRDFVFTTEAIFHSMY